MTEQFQITTDSASEHMKLVKIARLFDRYYYDAEEIGEVVNDGLQTAIKIVRQVHTIMIGDSCCLEWINPKLLHDLTSASNAIMDIHMRAMIAQAERERENNQEQSDQIAPTSDGELRQTTRGLVGVPYSKKRRTREERLP